MPLRNVDVAADAASLVARAGYAPGAVKAHPRCPAVGWPVTAPRAVGPYFVECSKPMGRAVLKISRAAEEVEFTIIFGAQNATCTTIAAPLRYWHIRALAAVGMVNCAASVLRTEGASVTDLAFITSSAVRWDPEVLLGGKILIDSALGDEADVRSPVDFQKSLKTLFTTIGASVTGAAILEAVRGAAGNVAVRFVPGQLLATTIPATLSDEIHIDPAVLNDKHYATLTADLVVADEIMPGWVAVAHEFIHIINKKSERDAARARIAQVVAKGWDNQEEVVTITGFMEGVVDPPRALSECAVLNDLHLPLRWSHRRVAEAGAPIPADMALYYGQNLAQFRFK